MFGSLTHAVQGRLSSHSHPLSFPEGFHSFFAAYMRRGTAELHFTSTPPFADALSLSHWRKKEEKRTKSGEKLKWQDEKEERLVQSTRLTWINVSVFPLLPALNHRLSCSTATMRLLTPRDTLRLKLSDWPFYPLHRSPECEWVSSHFYSISFQVRYSVWVCACVCVQLNWTARNHCCCCCRSLLGRK